MVHIYECVYNPWLVHYALLCHLSGSATVEKRPVGRIFTVFLRTFESVSKQRGLETSGSVDTLDRPVPLACNSRSKPGCQTENPAGPCWRRKLLAAFSSARDKHVLARPSSDVDCQSLLSAARRRCPRTRSDSRTTPTRLSRTAAPWHAYNSQLGFFALVTCSQSSAHDWLISERELMVTFAICHRPSVCLSVCHL